MLVTRRKPRIDVPPHADTDGMTQPHRMRSLIELDPEVAPPAALPDRIYAVLKHRILTCSMHPGERIVEKALCSELKVSRTPLREALNRLVLEDLVSLVPYRGYAVAPLTVDSFRELCELRRIVEAETAALTAERATPADVERLEQVAELRYTKGDRQTYQGYLRANSAFHLALVRCVRNRQLESVVMSALDKHQRPLYLGLDVGMDGKASTAEHRQVIDAIRRHDPARARTLMISHIAHAQDRIVGALRRAGY
jgi:GntR family transcriptional regulator, rspAB operon transcriptional repressor